nr:GMC family oxidoreductase N-terminal domain-containing protein [uncultured Duganella sp.]
MSDFDYIIVGGGTAGCILANRLTASGKHRVLMLEAGAEAKSMWVKIPAGFSKLLTNPVWNWRFQTEPEANTNNRVISVPRGKGLGGSTLINGMIYARGQPEDYDRWERAGARGWGFKDVEPYFKRVEKYGPGDHRRGTQGPMNLEQVAERFPISDAFLRAAREDGQEYNEDYNAGRQDGFGYYQVNQNKGQRWSVVDGYLKPARQRPNLVIETAAHVLRLDVYGRRCVGVTYRQRGQEISVKANLEVIMAAGAVQTPQILELSGIGNPALLRSMDIPVVHAAPNVGENYIDHFATRMNWRVKDALTLNEMARGWRLMLAVSEYYSRKSGILTLGTGLVHGFVKTDPAMATPDAQYFFVHASYANAAERILDGFPGMTIGVTQLRPESTGSIHIRSRDPLVGPMIRPNLLSTEVDRTCMVRAMRIARRIVGQPAMRPYVHSELSPGAGVRTDEEWLAFARQNGQTIYHPIGTCRMGGYGDDGGVVDLRLRFKGMDGLRVVDASVVPQMVSGNTQAVVMMVAEKGADLILEDARERAAVALV